MGGGFFGLGGVRVAVRVARTSQSRGWLFTAADLPRLMSVPDERGSYRSPVLQFVWDWNVAQDRGALVRRGPGLRR